MSEFNDWIIIVGVLLLIAAFVWSLVLSARNKKHGVRGWLLFFVLTIALNVYVLSIIAAGFMFVGDSATYVIGLLGAILAIVGMVSVVFLFQRNKYALLTTRYWLWGIVVWIFLLATVYAIYSEYPAGTFGYRIGEGVWGFVYVAIWLNYLKKSKRVKKTYKSQIES